MIFEARMDNYIYIYRLRPSIFYYIRWYISF